MSKAVKKLMAGDVHKRYCGFSSACVVDMTGMKVQDQERLRKLIRSKSGRVEVIKNRLTRFALQGTGLEPLGKSFRGPCALVTSSESAIDIARALMDAAKEFKALKLKQAIFEGDPSLLTVEQMAKMRGRRELLGEIAMLVSSPGRSLAGCLSSPQAKLAGCLKAIVKKGEAA